MYELTANELRAQVNYEPVTGIFTRLNSGKILGSRSSKGYLLIGFKKKQYYAHRLVWLYTSGRWPKEVIDHINGDKKDNRLCNLREATVAQNLRNRGPSKKNTTGVKGVHKNKDGYMVRVCIGTYKTLEEAKEVYEKAIRFYHGQFARMV